MDLRERVMAELENGHHCSQVVMQLSLDMRGRREPFTLRALGALGGGMFARRTCGTLTGAVCALSSYFPRGEGEREPAGYRALAKALVAWFEDTFGSTECRELVPDFTSEGILRVCPAMMEATFEKCVALLEEAGIDPTE